MKTKAFFDMFLILCLFVMPAEAQLTLPRNTIRIDLDGSLHFGGDYFLRLEFFEDSELYDYNFDDATFQYIKVDELAYLEHCSFKNAVFWDGQILMRNKRRFKDCDFTNAYFRTNFILSISPDVFVQTRNYQLKELKMGAFSGDFENFDFSDYEISCSFCPSITGAKFENAHFRKASIPAYFTQEQLKQTRNYRNGIFTEIQFLDPHRYAEYVPESLFRELDISNMSFSNCRLRGSFSGTNMTDTVFTESDLSTVEDLTLEQVKSTWNYKAGRMSLCKWPKYIEKALEEEKKQ